MAISTGDVGSSDDATVAPDSGDPNASEVVFVDIPNPKSVKLAHIVKICRYCSTLARCYSLSLSLEESIHGHCCS